MGIKGYFIGLFFLAPIIFFIHELGHAFFGKLCGYKLAKIEIGTGKAVFKIGLIEFKSVYFLGGHYYAENKIDNILGQMLMVFGGAIFNFFIIFICVLLLHNGVLRSHWLLHAFINFNAYIGIAALLPIQYFQGGKSDGQRIYYIIKHLYSRRKSKNTDQ